MASPNSQVVAIHGNRNAGLIVAVLSVIRSGLTFAVLDASYPRERLRHMATLIRPALIIGDDETNPLWRSIFEGIDSPFLSMDSGGTARVGNPPAASIPSHELDQKCAEFAYLLFTSGTTGVPKCIATRHAPLRHFIAWYCETFKPDTTDRFSLLSGLGHDPVLRDIFVPLSIGAEIRIPPQAAIANPKSLFQWIRDSGISFMHGTPPLFKVIGAGAQESGGSSHALRFIFASGDQLHRSHTDQIHRFAPKAQVVNFYGTTETPQAMAFHQVLRHEKTVVPVGRGIRDAQLLVLTASNTLAAVEELGQIGIRTRFLSAGYYGDPNATSQRFIPSPFSQDPADLIYLTGDYGYYRHDGEVVIRGRADDQVKIRGFRVELSEITKLIESLSMVRGALTLAHTAANEEKVLVAYVATDPICRDAAQVELNKTLTANLPSYMVPTRILWLDQIPLLPNGKIDRQALTAMWEAQQAEINRLTPDNDDSHQSRLTREWCKILGIVEVDSDKSFAELGGDSLSFIQASISVRKILGWLPEDWSRTPLSELAKRKIHKSHWWHPMDITILFRALSIILIVLGHITPCEVSGSVVLLFMLAGWSFANFQCRAILKQESSWPILNFMGKLALPTMLAVAWQNWGHFQDHWWAFLMLSSYFPLYPYRVAGFWFMDVLIQIFAILAIVFAFRVIRRSLSVNPFRFALMATVVSMAVGLGIHIIWDTKYLYNYVPHMYLWTVFFGMAMWHADTWIRKLLLMGLLLFCAVFHHTPVFSIIAATGVLFIKRVPIPAVLAPIVAAIAASSLYIYITHDMLGALLYGKLWGANVTYEMLGALQFHSVHGIRGVILTAVLVAAGVGIGMAYTKLYTGILRAVHRKPAASSDTSVNF